MIYHSCTVSFILKRQSAGFNIIFMCLNNLTLFSFYSLLPLVFSYNRHLKMLSFSTGLKDRKKYGIQCFSIYIFNPTMTGPLTAITNIMKGAFTAISNSMSGCMLSHLQGAGDTVKIKTITSEGLKQSLWIDTCSQHFMWIRICRDIMMSWCHFIACCFILATNLNNEQFFSYFF